ncbi:MAG: TetR/AcrR family transcriptional regulator [Proteobacteria bacterium]|nr:TetR/AcrR family transcriptional regulator [Pseudomonadota bacterium]
MSSKREQLIETAIELFAKNGFHATGVDTILAHAGVAKKTLYTHFRTKEELILAALRQHDGQFRNHFMKSVDAIADTPREKLLAIFDVTKSWFSQNNFYGCMFINAIGEYSEKNTSIREVCKEYKRLMRNYMKDLAEQAGINDAEELANELSLLLEGSIVTAQVSEQTEEAADTAKRVAKTLIDSYCN